MKQLTDEEIIKALECCSTHTIECEECPLYCRGANCSSFELHRLTLALINRQKAEIEELTQGINLEFEKFETEYDKKLKSEAYKEFAEKIESIFTPLEMNHYILTEKSVTIDTGVHIAIPHGYCGMLKSKSGLNVKFGLTGEGVIDSGYRGSICVKFYNDSTHDYHIKRGDKITQLVIMPINMDTLELVDELDDTERGNNGFGSSGR